MRTTLLFAAVATLVTGAAATTAHATERDEQIWVAPILQGPLAGKARFWLEAQGRLTDSASTFSTAIVRPAVYYPLGAGFNVFVGYAWTPTPRPTFRDEHRPWQQVNHVFEARGAQLQNRVRLEERFIEGTGGVVFRARYMARFVYRPKSWNGFGFALWDEIFVHLNERATGPRSGLDQNRIAFGPQYQPFKQLVLEPSYMLQTVYRENRPERVAHTFLLFVWITL